METTTALFGAPEKRLEKFIREDTSHVSRGTVGERRAASLELNHDLPARAGTAATWSEGD